MDYEKLYKEALERTKYFMSTRGVSPNEDPFEVAKELSETAFPELKEFEGESIRKRLIELLKNNDEQHYAKEIAWLEKQGEQKPANWFQELEDKLANATPKQLAEWKEKYFKEEPAEWSEEDEKCYSDILDVVNKDLELIHIHRDWFKNIKYKLQSLGHQKQWKPTAGQLECLDYAIDKAEKDYSPLDNNRIHLTLKALKEQLKKL